MTLQAAFLKLLALDGYLFVWCVATLLPFPRVERMRVRLLLAIFDVGMEGFACRELRRIGDWTGDYLERLGRDGNDYERDLAPPLRTALRLHEYREAA